MPAASAIDARLRDVHGRGRTARTGKEYEIFPVGQSSGALQPVLAKAVSGERGGGGTLAWPLPVAKVVLVGSLIVQIEI